MATCHLGILLVENFLFYSILFFCFVLPVFPFLFVVFPPVYFSVLFCFVLFYFILFYVEIWNEIKYFQVKGKFAFAFVFFIFFVTIIDTIYYVEYIDTYIVKCMTYTPNDQNHPISLGYNIILSYTHTHGYII